MVKFIEYYFLGINICFLRSEPEDLLLKASHVDPLNIKIKEFKDQMTKF